MYCEQKRNIIGLRRCETPPSPPTPDPVGIENCKQLFSPLLAFTIQKIATHSTDIIPAVYVAFFWVGNASRNEKSCLKFLIPTAVFHMLLRRCLMRACETLWSAREIASIALLAERERHTENVPHRLKAMWNTSDVSLLPRRERHWSYLSCTP